MEEKSPAACASIAYKMNNVMKHPVSNPAVVKNPFIVTHLVMNLLIQNENS